MFSFFSKWTLTQLRQMSHCKNKQIIILHFLKGSSMPADRKGESDTALGLWGFSPTQPSGGTAQENLPEYAGAQQCGTAQRGSGLFGISSDLGWPKEFWSPHSPGWDLYS